MGVPPALNIQFKCATAYQFKKVLLQSSVLYQLLKVTDIGAGLRIGSFPTRAPVLHSIENRYVDTKINSSNTNNVPALCQFKGWNAHTLDRPQTFNNMKKKPTLRSKVGSVHASLPTARQSGLFAARRKSWEKDPNVRKNFSPTIKPQLTQPGKIAPAAMFPWHRGTLGLKLFKRLLQKSSSWAGRMPNPYCPQELNLFYKSHIFLFNFDFPTD